MFPSLENSCVQVLQVQFDQPVAPGQSGDRILSGFASGPIDLLSRPKTVSWLIWDICRSSSSDLSVQRLPVGRQEAQTSAAKVASLARQSLVTTLWVRADVGDRRKN